MQTLRAFLGGSSNLLLYLAAFSTCLMMVHVTADVIAKLLFSQPILGTLEMVSLFYMVAAVFLPLAAVQRDRENVFIELFTQKMPIRFQKALDALSLAAMFVIAFLLFWKGYEVAMKKSLIGEMSQNLEFFIPIWPGRWFSVAGFGFMSLWCLLQFFEDMMVVLGLSDPDPQKDHELDGGV